MTNKVAVIILNYNSSDDCRRCVSFLKKQESVELELILVDNCSPDRDRVEAICHDQGCTLISSPENRGYNAGNNIGLRYTAEKGYKYALIANPDMEFQQTDYVKKLVEVMEMDETTVVVGSDIVDSDGIHQNPLIRDGDWTTSFNWIKGLFRKKKIEVYEYIDNYSKSHFCAKVSGCCLMVRMDFILEIGFFDEYPFLYCEEPILSRQVETAGKQIYYTADAQAFHRHIASSKGDPVKRFQQWKRSRLYFIDRYSGDSWIGKKIASFSVTLYVIFFTSITKIKCLQQLRKEINQLIW